MFFASKIRAVAEAIGAEITFPRSLEALVQKARAVKPQLIVVDLHNQKIDPATLATDLKADDELQKIPLLGFFSHVQTQLQQDALKAGFDQVVPRSVFARDLPRILGNDGSTTT